MIMYIFNKTSDYYKDWDVQYIIWQYIGYLDQKGREKWILCAPKEKVLYLTLW